MTQTRRQFGRNPNSAPAFATRIESHQDAQLMPEETFYVHSQRETRRSRLLTLYIGTGL